MKLLPHTGYDGDEMSQQLIREFVHECLIEEVTRRRFTMDLPQDLVALARLFNRAGHQLYVVGGAVRDALQGKEPKDYDVATDAHPDAVVSLLKQDPRNKVLEVGKAFGVVVCVTPAGYEYEIATFRRDVGKGRRPDAVEFTGIEDDVRRRDLTVNALFYDIDAGEVVDYVGGIKDIEDGVVRAVGDPKERFDEDRLRILRVLRFAARMGGEPDRATAQAILDDNGLQGVSPERIRDEFLKGFRSAKDVRSYLAMYDRFDLWSQVFPGLRISRDDPGPTRDVGVMLALVLGDNAPELLMKRLNALKYTSTEASQVSFLLRFRGLTTDNAYRLRKAANSCHVSDEQLQEYADQRGLSHQLVNAFLAYRPLVSGDDLKAQGFSGAELGKELERRETEIFRGTVGA